MRCWASAVTKVIPLSTPWLWHGKVGIWNGPSLTFKRSVLATLNKIGGILMVSLSQSIILKYSFAAKFNALGVLIFFFSILHIVHSVGLNDLL